MLENNDSKEGITRGADGAAPHFEGAASGHVPAPALFQTSDVHGSMMGELIRSLAEHAIFVIDTLGEILLWNEGASLSTGYPDHEVLGRNFSFLFRQEDQKDDVPRILLTDAAGRGRIETYGWQVRRDGSQLWCSFSVTALRCGRNGLEGFAVVVRNAIVQKAPEADATRRERMFSMLVQSVTDYAIYMLDGGGNVVSWNAGAERLKGYQASEIIGQHFSRFYTEDDRRSGLPTKVLETVLREGRYVGEGPRVRADGTEFWASIVIQPIRDENGALIGFAKTTRDLTRQKQQQDLLDRARQNLRLALENMSQGLCLFDSDERIILSNDRLRELLEIPEKSWPQAATLSDLIRHFHHKPGMDEQLLADAVHNYREQLLAGIASSDGLFTRELVHGCRTLNIHNRALDTGGWLATVEDITERRNIERKVSHLAYHDSLTTLANRVRFRYRLNEMLKNDAQFRPFAVIYLDLDRFKPINDTMGHAAGDLVLQITAARIQDQLRKNDLGARLGGDEFAILLDACSLPHDAERFASRLIQAITRPMSVLGLQVIVGTSVGIRLVQDGLQAPDVILRHADLALYRAKEGGRGIHFLYQPGMEVEQEERRLFERDLREAVHKDELKLHYQPVMHVDPRRLTGFEALLRWDSPKHGWVAPSYFIPVAEEIGIMPEIGGWVLESACRDALVWPGHLKLSVNLSPRQFRQPNLLAQIEETLQSTGFPAERLEFEITETAMIEDMSGALSLLSALRSAGIQIAMDDFGTGYSSLSFLRTMPFTRIKIDRSFVQDATLKTESAVIVRAIIGLCNSLNVATTAEGVETQEQLDFLIGEGCSDIQGYLISKPMVANHVLNWIAHGSMPLLVRDEGAAAST